MKKTSEVAHTPGPWQIGSMSPVVGISIWRSNGDGIAYRRICRNVSDEVDARLIAAAPELLEACKAVANDPYTTCACAEKVRAAIAKAAGATTTLAPLKEQL